MLIDSPRLTGHDRATWQRYEHYDDVLAASPRLDTITSKAMEVIDSFDADYVSCSWGKDSTVVVDLLGRTGRNVPVVWLRVDGYDMPECETVRDAVLARYPHLEYAELVFPPQPNRWWDDADVPQSKHSADAGWRMIAKRYGPKRVTGIRAEESKIRRIIQGRDGDASVNACRPIGKWSAVDVFAYLHREDLPVHPAYAMTAGGHYDRRWLRVHSLGGVTGADRGRSEWEQTYYGDIIAAARARATTLETPQWRTP